MFALDVLACPRCGGRLRVIAPVHEPLAVQGILAHLLRSEVPEPPGQPRRLAGRAHRTRARKR